MLILATYFVSRHAGAVAWCAQQGLPVDEVVSHLLLDQIHEGDKVLGTLPVQLAHAVCAKGAEYWHLSLDMPAHLRGKELTTDDMNQYQARLERFEIKKAS